jgi:hypothetical protein
LANNCAVFTFTQLCDLIDSFVIYSPNNHLIDKCIISSDYQTNDTCVSYPVIQSLYDHMYCVKFDKNKLNTFENHKIILQFDKPYQNDTEFTTYYHAIYMASSIRNTVAN